jgi:alpha/beta superfamily hydrolase
MNSRTLQHLIPISVGLSQVSIDFPEALRSDTNYKVRGIALIGHPHPLMGGTMDNKVAQTLAKTMTQLGYVSVRPNFRGVGLSEGVHDDGVGEMDDMYQILQWMQSPASWQALESQVGQTWYKQVEQMPVVLAGFSFGSYVNSKLAKRLTEENKEPERLVLVGSAAGKWEMPPIPQNTIVIHGELDDTIPLVDVFAWLKNQEVVVHVIPDADHFFHRKLHMIRDTIVGMWHGS